MNTRALLVIWRYAVSLAILIALWAGLLWIFNIPEYLLPHPFKVADTLFTEWGIFAEAANYTFYNTIVGGSIGIGLAMVVGVLAAYSRRVRWIVEPYLTVFQSFPREAFFPLIAVWLGFGAGPKIVNAGLLSFFPMAVIVLNGVIDTREDYLKLMRSLGASRLQTFLYCRMPAAVPSFIGGAKIALPLALIGSVLGEFLGGSSGLGNIIVTSGSAFRVDRIFAAIVVLAIGGTALVSSLDLLRHSLLRKFYQEKESFK